MPESADKPGPTGRFPGGKLNANDQGQLAVGVAIINDRIVLDFGDRPIQWIGMSADEADGFANLLKMYATKVRGLS